MITASAGNHAQGVAYAASKNGVKATIVMPTTTPLIKVNRTKSYGADVVLYGDVYDEACAHAYDLAEKEWKDWKSKEDILQDDLNILNQCEKIFYKNGKIELSKEIKEMIKTTEDKLSKTHDTEREYYQKFSQIQERVWKTI